MNRKVKFRGFSITAFERWVYGCLVNNLWHYSEHSQFEKGTPVCEIIQSGECDDYESMQNAELNKTVYPESVGQYTGLTDKNGKEIYEGDIIAYANGTVKINGQVKQNIENITVRIDEKGLYCNMCHYSHVEDSLEIIGNVYENKELIKQTIQ